MLVPFVPHSRIRSQDQLEIYEKGEKVYVFLQIVDEDKNNVEAIVNKNLVLQIFIPLVDHKDNTKISTGKFNCICLRSGWYVRGGEGRAVGTSSSIIIIGIFRFCQ